MPRPAQPIRERILRHLKPASSGCWEWAGFTHGRMGYGCIKIKGRKRAAHRIAYEALVGPIPEGLKLLHTCDNPLCCNPEHLRPGTQTENVADAIAKGRMPQLTTEWLRARGRGY